MLSSSAALDISCLRWKFANEVVVLTLDVIPHTKLLENDLSDHELATGAELLRSVGRHGDGQLKTFTDSVLRVRQRADLAADVVPLAICLVCVACPHEVTGTVLRVAHRDHRERRKVFCCNAFDNTKLIWYCQWAIMYSGRETNIGLPLRNHW